MTSGLKTTQNYPQLFSQIHVNNFPTPKITRELPFPLLTLMYSSALPDLGEDITEIAITMVFPLRKRKRWVGGVTEGTEEAKLLSYQLELHFYSREVEIHLAEVCGRGSRAPSPRSAGPKADLHKPERAWLLASLGAADADRQLRTVEQTE